MPNRQTTTRRGALTSERRDVGPGRANTDAAADGVPTRGSSETQPAQRLLRFPDIRSRTGLSRSTIWRLERQGGFPRHRRISANAVAWPEDEVLEWIRVKISMP